MSQSKHLHRIPEPAETPEAAAEPVRRRPSMMLSVLAMLVLVAVGPIALMGYKITSELETDLTANQKELQLEKATSIQEGVVDLIESRFQLLRLIGEAATSVAAVGAGQGLGNEKAVDELRVLLERYLDQEALQMLRLTPADPSLPAVTVHLPSFDPEAVSEQVDPLLARGVEKGSKGTESLSDPVLPRDGHLQPLAVISVPVGPRSAAASRRAVLSGVVSLAAVQRAVQAQGDTALGYTIFVLDSKGLPFAHTQFMKVVERADLSSNPLVEEFGKPGMAASSMSYETLHDGRMTPMIGTYAPIVFKDHR